MKRTFLLLLLALLPVLASAFDFEKDGIYYNFLAGGQTVEVTYRNDVEESYTGDVVIPEYANGYKVVAIGDNAFSYCNDVSSVTMSDGITDIGYRAFYACSFLTSLDIPGSVTNIGEEAFLGCLAVRNITFHEGLVHIGAYAFRDNWSLTSVVFPSSVRTIGEWAFAYCKQLTSVTIPEGVTSLGGSAFAWCTVLAEVTIPGSLQIINEFAFGRCKALTSVTIPDGITRICSGAFANCEGLTNVVVGKDIEEIENTGFSGCTALASGSFTCLATNPPSAFPNTFDEDHYLNMKVYVPYGSLEAYQRAYVWRDFENIYELPEPEVSEEFTGKLWQEVIDPRTGDPVISSPISEKLTLTHLETHDEVVKLTYAGFKPEGSTNNFWDFTIDGINTFTASGGTVYCLPDPKFITIRVGKKGLPTDFIADLEGMKNSAGKLIMKLMLTPANNQTMTLWFGSSPLQLNQVVNAMETVADLITGIPPIKGTEGLSQGEEEIYMQGSTIVNLAGQRLSKLQKGINIVGGKKVLIK